LGDALLSAGSLRPEELIEAGWHVLRGGDERRGADLLAEAAPKLASRGVATSAALPALEAALELYEKQGRAPRECLRLRTTMVGSMDRRICGRYGDETAQMLFYYAGAPIAAKLRPLLGASLSLIAGVLFSTVRRWFTPPHRRGPRPLTAVAAFYRTAYALMTTRTSTMDLAGMERLTAQAEALYGAGPMGEVTALFLRGATCTLRAMPEEGRRYQRRALELAKANPDFGGRVGAAARRGVMASIYIGLGMIETQYELHGGRALEVVDELAKLTTDPSVLEPGSEEIAQQGGITTPELTMAAHQIRMMYHLMRGEREKAEAHRDKLQLHTIQTGLQFQFDVWRTLIELVVARRVLDLAAMRRAGELLVQLTPQYPVLAPFLDLARSYLSFSLGKPQEALTTMAKWVPALKPGDIAGWDSLYSSYAEMLMAVGDPHRARDLMQSALASPAAREEAPSALTLTLELQLARAEAELNDTSSALARIDRLMEQLRDADQPVHIGVLHETGAIISERARNRARRDAHVDLMKRWYALTRNPSLLMRAQRVVESLAESEASEGHAHSVPPDQPEVATRVTTQRQMAGVDELFNDCKTPDERAARALHIIVEQSAGTSGHLFLWKEDRLKLAATLESQEASDEMERALQERFETTRDHPEPMTPGDAHGPVDISVVTLGTGDGGSDDERFAAIMLGTGGRRGKLIGAVALRIGSEMLRPMRKPVLEALARNIVSDEPATS
jgi:tetratricopeptide (TPR) repeat protein